MNKIIITILLILLSHTALYAGTLTFGKGTGTATFSVQSESPGYTPPPPPPPFTSGGSAYPGAMGWGAKTVGGRQGKLYIVNNLNDSGTSSFREACESGGTRVVTFNVSGTVEAQTPIEIGDPFISIYGQTSPSGFQVTGRGIVITSNDVIMQFMKVRAGTALVDYEMSGASVIWYSVNNAATGLKATGNCAGTSTLTMPEPPPYYYPCPLDSGINPANIHALEIYGPLYGIGNAFNVMIANCSFAWGVDETVVVSGGVWDVTIAHSIVAEGLATAGHDKGVHSKGVLINSASTGASTTVTLHDNFLSNSADRNPWVGGSDSAPFRADVFNNVAHAWKGYLTMNIVDVGAVANARVNLMQNYLKKGFYSHDVAYEAYCEHGGSTTPGPLYYLENNLGSFRLSEGDGDWAIAESWNLNLLSTDWQRLTPWALENAEVATMTDSYAEDTVVANAGAILTGFRDDFDQRIVDGYSNPNVKFMFLDDSSHLPTIANVTYTDVDSDGMEDVWEAAEFGDLTQTHDGDFDGDGYTNIEEFAFYKGGYQ